jgi:predicted aspartyl protease
VDEGVSVDTTGLRIPEESAKMEGGQGEDKQQLEGEEGGHTYWWKRVKGRRVREIYPTGAD